ncbi:MAG: DUF2252 family protein [Planctomycetes bacterium]|nr:DUF2252 family protein [Planctomycetota bacterium]
MALKSQSTLGQIKSLNPHLTQDDPRALPMKVRSLLVGPYNFFRGTADLFYDWSNHHAEDWLRGASVLVILHGDVHIGNVGTFLAGRRDSDDLGFGLVDFDEAVRGPFQLDLLRALSALRFAAEERDIDINDWNEVADELLAAYVHGVSNGTSTKKLATQYSTVADLLAKARESDHADYVAQFCDPANPNRFRTVRFKKDHPTDLMELVDAETREKLVDAFCQYADRPLQRDTLKLGSAASCRAAVLDVARWTRLESSGSQGIPKFLVLLNAPAIEPRHAIMFELKSEPTPAATRASSLGNPIGPIRAQFVAEAFRRALAPPPWLVGWTQTDEAGFLVRPKNPWNEELSHKNLKKQKHVRESAAVLGAVIGAAHGNSLEPPTQRESLAKRVDSERTQLADSLVTRSRAIQQDLLHAYENLAADPAAIKQKKRAEDFIESSARSN